MAACAWHAYVLGKEDDAVTEWFYKGMSALAEEHTVDNGWVLMEFGK